MAAYLFAVTFAACFHRSAHGCPRSSLISQQSNVVECMFSLLIEPDILKAPSLAFKHWSNVGRPAFTAPVLSTSSSRQGFRECAHTLAVSLSQTCFAWKDIHILNLSPDNHELEVASLFRSAMQKNKMLMFSVLFWYQR